MFARIEMASSPAPTQKENEGLGISGVSESLNEMKMNDTIPAKTHGPVCIIVLGMAGSGKTSFVQRITSHLYARKQKPYVINLDPACREVPYPANIGKQNDYNFEVMCVTSAGGPWQCQTPNTRNKSNIG